MALTVGTRQLVAAYAGSRELAALYRGTVAIQGGAWWQGATDLDFANGRFRQDEQRYNSFADWAASRTLSISVSTDATYFDGDGVLQNAAANALRFDYNPATLEPWGVLLEGERTNIKVRSQDWTNVSFYNSVRVTGTAHAGLAPDGTMTADRFLEQAVTNTFHHDSAAIVISTGVPYSYSAFLSPIGRQFFSLDVSNVTAITTFDVDGDAVVATSGVERNGGGIAPINNGWDRLWQGFTETATTSVNPRVWINALATDGIAGTHAGDIAKGFLGWGMQLEAGAFPSSHIRTPLSATVTRSADLWTETVEHEATGSVRLYFRTAPGKQGDQVLWQRDDGTEDNRIRCVRESDGHLHWVVTNGGTDIVDIDLGEVSDLTAGFTDFRWADDDFGAALDAGTETTVTSGAVPAGLTAIRRGHNVAGTSNWFGWFAREVRGVAKAGIAPFSLKIGYATDLHSSQVKPDHDGLYLSKGAAKAQATVDLLNSLNPDITIHGGDLIETYGLSYDGDDAIADALQQRAIWDSLNHPWHFVCGNHDLDQATREQLETALGQPSGYRSFDHGGVHVVILDGCYTEAGAIYSAGNFDTNGIDSYIHQEQLDWLADDLAATSLPTIIFVHQRLDTDTGGHVINKADVRAVLEAAPGEILAVIQGHHHRNGIVVINGIRYVAMKDMATDSGDTETTCALIQITRDHVIIKGFNDQSSHLLARVA